MLIAIDYDLTYTEDPQLWQSFLVAAKRGNHKVIICTARCDKDVEEVIMEVGTFIRREDIYNTSYKAKKAYMDKLGVYVDVWIDDDPFSITVGYETYGDFSFKNKDQE